VPEERFSGGGGTNLATICFLPLFILVKFNFVEKGVLSYKVENVSVAPLGKWKTNIIFYFTVFFFRNACTKSGSLRFSQFSGC
jgi:hypothetical protein